MKALKIVLIVLLSLVAIVLIYLSTLDGSYKVTRSIEIDHPAEKVTAHIANLESWAEWSYWNLMDSTNEMSFGDIRSGEGATYTWTGMETGQGEVEVLEVTDDGTVKTMISFIEPMESQMNSDFFVTSEGGKTKISWENYGELPFMLRWMGGGMDNAFGGQLETGLDSLKTQLERMNNNM